MQIYVPEIGTWLWSRVEIKVTVYFINHCTELFLRILRHSNGALYYKPPGCMFKFGSYLCLRDMFPWRVSPMSKEWPILGLNNLTQTKDTQVVLQWDVMMICNSDSCPIINIISLIDWPCVCTCICFYTGSIVGSDNETRTKGGCPDLPMQYGL